MAISQSLHFGEFFELPILMQDADLKFANYADLIFWSQLAIFMCPFQAHSKHHHGHITSSRLYPHPFLNEEALDYLFPHLGNLDESISAIYTFL